MERRPSGSKVRYISHCLLFWPSRETCIVYQQCSQHCHLKDIKRVVYETIDDEECLDAFMQLSRLEGIIPALESAHAVAYAMKIAKDMPADKTILVNLSGRGDKDADFVADKLGL